MTRRAITCLLLATRLLGCADEPAEPTVRIGRGEWTVELALTPEARYRGLSGRASIPPGTGMLFLYPGARRMDFCMRDCLVPIDIAFIGPDKRVVAMYTMEIDPSGERSWSSGEPARWVLEVAAGALEKAGVRVGSAVSFENVPDASKAAEGL